MRGFRLRTTVLHFIEWSMPHTQTHTHKHTYTHTLTLIDSSEVLARPLQRNSGYSFAQQTETDIRSVSLMYFHTVSRASSVTKKHWLNMHSSTYTPGFMRTLSLFYWIRMNLTILNHVFHIFSKQSMSYKPPDSSVLTLTSSHVTLWVNQRFYFFKKRFQKQQVNIYNSCFLNSFENVTECLVCVICEIRVHGELRNISWHARTFLPDCINFKVLAVVQEPPEEWEQCPLSRALSLGAQQMMNTDWKLLSVIDAHS